MLTLYKYSSADINNNIYQRKGVNFWNLLKRVFIIVLLYIKTFINILDLAVLIQSNIIFIIRQQLFFIIIKTINISTIILFMRY